MLRMQQAIELDSKESFPVMTLKLYVAVNEDINLNIGANDGEWVAIICPLSFYLIQSLKIKNAVLSINKNSERGYL